MNSIVDQQLSLLRRASSFFDRHFSEMSGELELKAPSLNECEVEHRSHFTNQPIYSSKEIEIRKNNLASDVSAFMHENPKVRYLQVKAPALKDFRIEITLHPTEG